MSVMVKVRHSDDQKDSNNETDSFLPKSIEMHALRDKLKCRCYLRVPWYSAAFWAIILLLVSLSAWYVWRIEKLTQTFMDTEDILKHLRPQPPPHTI